MIFVFLALFLIFLWFFLRLRRKPDLGIFNLYFGSPGCGKTTFLVRIAKIYAKKGRPVFTNFPVTIPGVCCFEKADIGKFAFPPGAVILFDEGSLNGFDNRDFKTNFKNNNSLEYFKLLRHYCNQIVFANQGFDELDKKIRTLTTGFWFVRRIGPFSIANRVFKKTEVNQFTHEIIDGYQFPAGIKTLLFPRYMQLIFRPSFYKYFDSYDAPELPQIESRMHISVCESADAPSERRDDEQSI